MAKSRTKQPLLKAFGGVLASLHEEYEVRLGKKMSHNALARLISRRLADNVSPAVSIGGTTLWRWEAGEVSAPSPLVLKEMGSIYGVAFEQLLLVLEANLREPSLSVDQALAIIRGDLACQPSGETSVPSAKGGEPDVPASVAPGVLGKPTVPVEDVVDVAARLIEYAEQLQEAALALLGRQAPTPGDAPPWPDADHRTDNRPLDRTGTDKGG
jgi:hypothetical protein